MEKSQPSLLSAERKKMPHPHDDAIRKSIDWMIEAFEVIQRAGGYPPGVIRGMDRETLCTLISNNIKLKYDPPGDSLEVL